MDKLKAKIAEPETRFWLETNLRKEKDGLIIIEAYYGLDEHIYQIDAELVRYKIPETVQEYNDV